MNHAKFLTRFPALVGLSAAALVTLASGTAVAAPSHPSAVTAATAKFTWHPLKLLNGWGSASMPKLKTGTPSWALRGGVIYLRGAIKVVGVKLSSTFAHLPTQARPAHNLYIQAYTDPTAAGTVWVGHDGDLEAFNGQSATFTSLAGVSYPLATIKSHKLALQNGWVSSQSQWGTGDPAYAISGGVVYLSGSLKSGTETTAFTLPKAARPSHQLLLSVYTNGGTTGVITVTPAGTVFIQGLDSTNFTSLANISYPVAGTRWHHFTLVSGWKSGSALFHTASPAYTIINGVVYFTGTMFDPKGTTGFWTTLPKGVKTAADVLDFEVYMVNGSSGGIGVTNSFGLVVSDPFTNAQGCTSLAGIAYPQGS